MAWFILVIGVSFSFAAKILYTPNSFAYNNIDLNNPESQWSHSRKTETDNWVIFWEPGFGSDPSQATGDFYVNMTQLKQVLETSYAINRNTLKMAIQGQSKSDQYKMIVFLKYSTVWGAYGSGQDDVIGSLEVNPAAANIPSVVAHEIGHTFQYQAGCDVPEGGFRYGFGPNASGGNGFWEQSAQWQSFQVYPEEQFHHSNFTEYIRSNHLHLLHESPRYANYFIPDYWTYKQGIEFMGKLWRESRKPEDPIEAYQRLTQITQAEFNAEMYEHASRLTTFDLPAIRSYGESSIHLRAQVLMNPTAESFWRVDSSVTIENYGYNSIQLNAPSKATPVSVYFKGLAGENGYRSLNIEQAGWRLGFVALLQNGTRDYSDMFSLDYAQGKNPEGLFHYTVPSGCTHLWLVVSGAPQKHWRHAWDDDNSNDEQWPYEVQFVNTNLWGQSNPTTPLVIDTQTVDITQALSLPPASDYTPTMVPLDSTRLSKITGLTPKELSAQWSQRIQYYALKSDDRLDSQSTAVAPGHWFDSKGSPVAYGSSSVIFSEIDTKLFNAKIGQYPDRLSTGTTITLRQALLFQKSTTEVIRVNYTFNIQIVDPHPVLSLNPSISLHWSSILQNGSYSVRLYNSRGDWVATYPHITHIQEIHPPTPGVYQLVVMQGNHIKASGPFFLGVHP